MAGWSALLAAAACAFAVGLMLDSPFTATTVNNKQHVGGGLAAEIGAGRYELVDLSVALSPGVVADPPPTQYAIDYKNHRDTVDQMVSFFAGLSQSDLPGGEAWAVERLNISTHSGTHVDAPYHFATTMDGDERAIAVDELPLDWFLRPAVKLDFRHLADGHVVSGEDVASELARIGHKLQPFDIVVVNTRAGQRYGHSDYLLAGCGMGRNATLWLCERGVKVMGTDAWSWDAPFAHTARRYAESRDPSIIWEGHKAGRECGYAQIEKLANLDKIPATGFFVAVFPVKISGASAGWTRAVAFVPK